jgi:uracil-DNA glycosylase family 4
MMAATMEEKAEALYERIRSCQLCPLAVTRTHAVPGEGPLDAQVMFIGEAPGANEDKQGRPFVGAAGNFLSELLAAAGYRREDVYICNVLKCRPPGNRDPLPGEIDACRDYLDEQIDLIDPLVVVTLGRYSMSKFFPRQSISKIHGQPKEIAGTWYVPMYHPAAALHQGNLREVMLRDFARLPEIVERARSSRRGAVLQREQEEPPQTRMLAEERPPVEPPPVEPSPADLERPQGQPQTPQGRLFD